MPDTSPSLRCVVCDAPLELNHERKTTFCSDCLAALRNAADEYKRNLTALR